MDADAAQEALELIEVEYEPLPGVFDAAAALGAPMAAIANAVENAIGIRLCEQPMSPPRVLKAIDDAAGAKA